ncbi:MAG: phosphonate metabolism protein/1,5-bisphosphokinase (PRPP-forming) PhnN, partial [Pseudomonadota bacterium]
ALTAILVTVSPEILADRLRARGRETEDQIARRIERARQFMRPQGQLEIIQNDSDLEIAGERLIQLLGIHTMPSRAFA